MEMKWPSNLTCRQRSNTKKLKGREGEYEESRGWRKEDWRTIGL